MDFRRLCCFCLPLVVFAQTAAAGGAPPLRESAARAGLALPQPVFYADLLKSARDANMREQDLQGALAHFGVTLRGAGGGKYANRADLWRACGAACTKDNGFGILLAPLLRPQERGGAR